jgi:hypothetical protein
VPIAPPVRKIDRHGIDVLNARRAGNRGKSKRFKTTPVSAKRRKDPLRNRYTQ